MYASHMGIIVEGLGGGLLVQNEAEFCIHMDSEPSSSRGQGIGRVNQGGSAGSELDVTQVWEWVTIGGYQKFCCHKQQ